VRNVPKADKYWCFGLLGYLMAWEVFLIWHGCSSDQQDPIPGVARPGERQSAPVGHLADPVVVYVHSGAVTAAWIALGISSLTLIWNIAELVVRWPRVNVLFSDSEFIDGQPGSLRLGQKLHIVAVNNGAEATSIATVGVRGPDGLLVEIRMLGNEHQDTQESKLIEGPELPARIEAHGALEWNLFPDLLLAPKGTAMTGYVRRYQTPRGWPWPRSWRSPFRISESSNTCIKRGWIQPDVAST
jgi:hypothetical protein